MQALRALKHGTVVMASAAALTFAAASSPPAEGTIPSLAGSVPAVGGNIGDVITTTCGNSPVIVLAVIICQAQVPPRT